MAETCSFCAGDAVEVCSACGKAICADHTERALPYLSLGDFLGTIVHTLFRTPSALPALLFDPGDEEPFCPECVQANSERRVQEQRKFFYLMFGMMILCAVIVYVLVRFL